MANSVSRRDILKTIGAGAMAGTMLQAVPAEAAKYAHDLIAAEKSAAPDATYAPKFFSPQQFKTLSALCQTIFPADAESGGAIEAGAPEFIDLLTSEIPEMQRSIGGGLMWLDSRCVDLHGNPYLDCTAEQQKAILDQIAYRKNETADPSLTYGVDFFASLRSLTADGFFTSKIGIQYLGYMGNTFLTEFRGCPPVPGV